MTRPQDGPAAPEPRPPASHMPPAPRQLPTWVNVVLILILFASCGANDETEVDSGSVARQVVQQLRGDETTSSMPATQEDVAQLCRLLAAVAAKQGVDAAKALGEDLGTACDEGARGR